MWTRVHWGLRRELISGEGKRMRWRKGGGGRGGLVKEGWGVELGGESGGQCAEGKGRGVRWKELGNGWGQLKSG